MLQHLLSIASVATYSENIVFGYFLGMCGFLACSKRMEHALGLGIAVLFLMQLATPVNWMLNAWVLQPGALQWTGVEALARADLSSVRLIVVVSVIATVAVVATSVIEYASPAQYAALGFYLPLIAVDCSIFGVSLLMIDRELGFLEAQAFAFGSGLGFVLAIVGMAGMRWKLRPSNPPRGLRGLGLTLVTMGLMSMTFLLFAGLQWGEPT